MTALPRELYHLQMTTIACWRRLGNYFYDLAFVFTILVHVNFSVPHGNAFYMETQTFHEFRFLHIYTACFSQHVPPLCCRITPSLLDYTV